MRVNVSNCSTKMFVFFLYENPESFWMIFEDGLQKPSYGQPHDSTNYEIYWIKSVLYYEGIKNLTVLYSLTCCWLYLKVGSGRYKLGIIWRDQCRNSMVPRSVRLRKLSNIGQPENLLSRAPPCFKRHIKPLILAFVVVSNHQPSLGLRGGLWPVVFMCNPLGTPVPQQWGLW
jgi:hypothetical protein